MLKRLNNRKGVTLTELIAAMLVLSIIMLAVSMVFVPLFNAYVRANNFAEINTILDNISAVILSDLANAAEVPVFEEDEGMLTIEARPRVQYSMDGDIIVRDVGGRGSQPIFHEGFYRNNSVRIDDYSDDTLTLVLGELRRDGTFGEIVRRSYAVRPLGLE
jgi:prepilin-type N-terminal cleavage/methylation domain-containing protein